ncbi:hypothetical protein [Shewanella seohaensis]|uniref:Uncharacterized protein n=1 Tax=Shewanella seohaensis TaxID=755175 RepID=A0ABV4VR95_9GAMM
MLDIAQLFVGVMNSHLEKIYAKLLMDIACGLLASKVGLHSLI